MLKQQAKAKYRINLKSFRFRRVLINKGRRANLGCTRESGQALEYLLALLAFIRTAHYWTVVHPGLKIEDDVRALLSENKELASLLLQDPALEYRHNNASGSIK
jgi:hypothetical protein